MTTPQRPDQIRGIGSNQHGDKPPTTSHSASDATATGKAAGSVADTDPFSSGIGAVSDEAIVAAFGQGTPPTEDQVALARDLVTHLYTAADQREALEHLKDYDYDDTSDQGAVILAMSEALYTDDRTMAIEPVRDEYGGIDGWDTKILHEPSGAWLTEFNDAKYLASRDEAEHMGLRGAVYAAAQIKDTYEGFEATCRDNGLLGDVKAQIEQAKQDVFTSLYDASNGGDEVALIDDLAVRSGHRWKCECGWMNPREGSGDCEGCGAGLSDSGGGEF